MALKGLSTKVAQAGAAKFGYDIKESPTNFDVDYHLPKDVNPDDVKVAIEPDRRVVDIMTTNFTKRFKVGHTLDVKNLKTDFVGDHLVIHVPEDIPESPAIKTGYAYTPPTKKTAAPGYEVKESQTDYEVDIHIPEGIQANEVKVELAPNGYGVDISGSHILEDEHDIKTITSFTKRLTCGHELDMANAQVIMEKDHMVVKVPRKMH